MMMLINYVREPVNIEPTVDENGKVVKPPLGKPVACIVAVGDSEGFCIGVSKCRKGDLFKKSMARKIAEGRADKNNYFYSPAVTPTTPYHAEICAGVEKMVNRAEKYFKTDMSINV